MKSYQELKKEVELLAKVAEDARKREAKEVVQQVLKTLEQHGLTVEDLLPKKARKNLSSLDSKRIVPPKYKGPKGETWTGRGQKPVWLAELIKAGHKKEEYLI